VRLNKGARLRLSSKDLASSESGPLTPMQCCGRRKYNSDIKKRKGFGETIGVMQINFGELTDPNCDNLSLQVIL